MNEKDQEVFVIGLDGALNEQNADDLLDRIECQAESGLRRVIVDCTNVRHISSYGLGVLIRIHHRMRKRGGYMKIAGAQGVTADAIRMTRLDKVFDIHPDVQEARRAFQHTAAT